MNVSTIFKESTTVAKANPLIFIPMLATSVLSALLSLIFVGSAMPMADRFSAEQISSNPEQALAGAGIAAGGMFLVGILSGFIGLLTHSMTVVMADTALKGEQTSLKLGWTRTLQRIVPVIIASVLIGIIVTVGMIMLVLPGIVLALFLMFTLVAVMVDKLGAFKAIGHSFRTVSRNFGTTFITFLVIIGLAILTMIISTILALVPILGAILSLLVSALFTGFITIFIVRVYRDLETKPEASPEVEI
jgi:MFS family permease